MSRFIRFIGAGALAAVVVLFGSGAAMAGASPAKAPSSGHGSFICTTGSEGTYITNTGHSMATPWEAVHVAGDTNLFISSTINLSVVTLDKTTGMVLATTPQPLRVKGNGNTPAPVSCTITTDLGTAHTTAAGITLVFVLHGTVTGKIVTHA